MKSSLEGVPYLPIGRFPLQTQANGLYLGEFSIVHPKE
jgi:hypothetical protein